VLLLWWVDLGAMYETLKEMQLTWALVAALSVVAATMLGAINLYLFVNRDNRLPFPHFLPIYWIAWAFGLVVPGQVGDIASLSVMMRRRGLSWQASLGRTLLDKSISFLLMSLFGLCGLISIFAVEYSISLTVLLTLLSLACVGPALYWLCRSMTRRLSPRAYRAFEFLEGLVREAGDLVRAHPTRVGLNILLTVFKISLIGAAYWCMFKSVGSAQIPLTQMILVAAASSLVAYLPISMNGLGTVEFVGVALFAQLGIADSTTLTVYFALRLLVVALAWSPTAIWLLLGRKHTGQTFSQDKP
jgi:uncharacterized membrane protein YbhN (UPF0104 family)